MFVTFRNFDIRSHRKAFESFLVIVCGGAEPVFHRGWRASQTLPRPKSRSSPDTQVCERMFMKQSTSVVSLPKAGRKVLESSSETCRVTHISKWTGSSHIYGPESRRRTTQLHRLAYDVLAININKTRKTLQHLVYLACFLAVAQCTSRAG